MKTLTLMICTAVIVTKIIDVVGYKLAPPVAVDAGRAVTLVHDTVVTLVHDTVVVVSRAADTIRVMVKQIGPLTERDLVRLICGRDGSYGDGRDAFAFNAYGMVFCPKAP